MNADRPGAMDERARACYEHLQPHVLASYVQAAKQLAAAKPQADCLA